MNVCLLLLMDVGEYLPLFCFQRLLASRARTSRTTSSCWASLSWASTKLSLLLRLASKMWKTQTRWMHFFFYGCKETTTAKEYNTMSHVGLRLLLQVARGLKRRSTTPVYSACAEGCWYLTPTVLVLFFFFCCFSSFSTLTCDAFAQSELMTLEILAGKM